MASTWQEAVAQLARERSQAENLVRLLKKHGGAAAVDRGSIVYGEAKAEYDGVIAGLIVALARGKQPATLPDLQARLERGFVRREAFRASVEALLPPEGGQKGVIEEAVKGAVGPLIQAIKDLFLRSKDDDAIMRKTIQTQLEAARWPDFTAIEAGR